MDRIVSIQPFLPEVNHIFCALRLPWHSEAIQQIHIKALRVIKKPTIVEENMQYGSYSFCRA